MRRRQGLGVGRMCGVDLVSRPDLDWRSVAIEFGGLGSPTLAFNVLIYGRDRMMRRPLAGRFAASRACLLLREGGFFLAKPKLERLVDRMVTQVLCRTGVPNSRRSNYRLQPYRSVVNQKRSTVTSLKYCDLGESRVVEENDDQVRTTRFYICR
jgi:hypothetical protein